MKSNDYELKNGDVVLDYYNIERPDYVLIIAQNSDDKIALVRQYRRGTDEILWELPAGWVDKEELPEQSAVRELQEETGFVGEVSFLGSLSAQPGFMNMKAHVFLGNIAKEVATNMCEDEDIEKELFSIEEIETMIRNGKIVDMGCVAAINLFLLNQKI